jgi:hypothetical protein
VLVHDLLGKHLLLSLCCLVVAAADQNSPREGATMCADGCPIRSIIHIKLNHPAAHTQATLNGGSACKAYTAASAVGSTDGNIQCKRVSHGITIRTVADEH